MRHHTVTTTFSAPPDEVFDYLADIDNLPEVPVAAARVREPRVAVRLSGIVAVFTPAVMRAREIAAMLIK